MFRSPAWLRAPALAGVFVCALLAGCATPPQLAQALRDWPADLPPQAEIRPVPFYPQEDYECGPAALAMVATAAGVPLKPEQLVEQVYLPGRKGSLQQEMLAAGRRQGLVPYVLAPQLQSLLREVAAGHPVVVFQNLSLPVFPVWHYAVAIGYDREAGTLLLHSGRLERMEMALSTFERTWARGDHWAMTLLPPEQLPATAQADAYVAALAALERVDAAAAQRAYARALQVWPDHRLALFGAGNTAYAAGQRDAAIGHFRRAVDHYPAFADAWNNLAEVLLEQGQTVEATQAAERAVALGGPRLPRYRELLERIRASAQGR